MMELRDYQNGTHDAVLRGWGIGKWAKMDLVKVHAQLIENLGSNPFAAAGADPVRSLLANLATSAGKCLGRGTLVLMADGDIKPVEEVKVGDSLMGPDSTPRRVESLATGVEMLYRVKPVCGSPYVVNKSHILSLRFTGLSGKRISAAGRKFTENDIANITVDEWLGSSPTFKHVAKGWAAPVEWPEQPTHPDLPPYILGVWLGDGNNKLAAIANVDPEVQEEWARHAESIGLGIRHEKIEGKCDVLFATNGRTGKSNRLTDALRESGAAPKNRIPKSYRVNSPHVQAEILAGILDTDGYRDKNGYEIVSIYPKLAQDIAFLARSLGLRASVNQVEKGCQTGAHGTYWRVNIGGDCTIIPCRVARRKQSKPGSRTATRVAISLEPIGEGEYFGFEISGTDRLFLLGDFTVTHNTIIAAKIIESMLGEGLRGIFMADSNELCQQPLDKLRSATGIYAGLEKASDKAPRSSKIVVASAQTLANPNRLEGFIARWGRPQFVIVDECFPAGTLIDGNPIETLRIGDWVTSWDERRQTKERRRVMGVWATSPSMMVRVHLGGEVLNCTAGHPFLTKRGWIPARALTASDSVLTIGDKYEPTPLHSMRSACAALENVNMEAREIGHPPDMLRLPESSDLLHALRRSDSGPEQEAEIKLSQSNGNVLPKVPERRAIGSAQGIQSNEGLGSRSAEMRNHAPGDGVEAHDSRRKRQGADFGSTTISLCAGVGDGNSHPDQNSQGAGVPNLLQGGHWKSGLENCHRDRRELPRGQNQEGAGPKEGSPAQWVGVDRVEVLEQTSDGTFGGVCEDGLVYNLKVEGTETYTVGSGFVVHNCHRGSPRNKKITDACGPECLILGITATAFRASLKDLSDFYEMLCFELGTFDLIGQGYITPLKVQTVPVSVDLTKVRIANKMGEKDYNADDVDTAMTPHYEQLADTLIEHASGRQVISFLPLVKSSKAFVNVCRRRGINAQHVDGFSEDRKEILEAFEKKEFNVLCNSQLLTTGWDCPPCDTLLNLRPTKSAGLFQQMVGRIARVLPGVIDRIYTAEARRAAIAASAKPSALIIDPLWNVAELGLAGPGSLIAENAEDASEIAKKIKEAMSPEDIEMIAKMVQSEREEKLRKELEARSKRAAGLMDARELALLIHDKKLLNYEPVSKWEMGPASEKQSKLIESIGLNPETINSKGLASKVLDAVLSRQSKGLAPLDAFRQLRAAGVERPEICSLDEAIRILRGCFPMTFGKKYKGVPMEKVPKGFWQWMDKQCNTSVTAGQMYAQEKNHPAAFRYMRMVMKSDANAS